MARTSEQRAAEEALRAAITSVGQAESPGSDSDGVLVDFVVIAQYSRFNEDGEEVSAYLLQFPNGRIPSHRAIGLFRLGESLLRDGPSDD